MSVDTLRSLRSAICSATGIEPVPFSSKTIQELPSISYTMYRQGDNAVVETWRFQTRITAESLEEVIDIEETIADLLVSLGDEEKFGTLNIQVNGGGTIEDEATGLPQLITYYDIQMRSNE